MAKNIHRSNRDANVAERGRFLAWARLHPEDGFKQAQEERETKPWQIQALRSREGEAAAAAIREVYLAPLVEAQAEVSVASDSPAKLAAQARFRKAQKRYAEVEAALRPRRRR